MKPKIKNNPVKRFFNEVLKGKKEDTPAKKDTGATPDLAAGLKGVNIKNRKNECEIDVAAPGLDKKDLNIEVDNHVLTISAEKKHEDEKKDKNFLRQEFGYASFQRSFRLPENIDEDNIKAKHKNGVLRITLPKTEPDSNAQKSIDIQ